MKRGNMSPSDDFTSRVMSEVKKRPRKIGFWNLIYFMPVVVALLVVATPVGRTGLLKLTNEKHMAVTSTQKQVDDMQAIAKDLTQFELDPEVEEIFTYEQSQ